jgi:hypothetical protein
MKLEFTMYAEESGLVLPEVVVPGLTSCGSSYCTSSCSCSWG